MTTGNAGLELRGVTKVFGGGYFNKNVTLAVDDRSLSISSDQPGITAIAGESGSGKTTIARLLMGIVEPTSGEVLYNGKNVAKMSRSERTVSASNTARTKDRSRPSTAPASPCGGVNASHWSGNRAAARLLWPWP